MQWPLTSGLLHVWPRPGPKFPGDTKRSIRHRPCPMARSAVLRRDKRLPQVIFLKCLQAKERMCQVCSSSKGPGHSQGSGLLGPVIKGVRTQPHLCPAAPGSHHKSHSSGFRSPDCCFLPLVSLPCVLSNLHDVIIQMTFPCSVTQF